jgi:hypothetical protein
MSCVLARPAADEALPHVLEGGRIYICACMRCSALRILLYVQCIVRRATQGQDMRRASVGMSA